MAVRACHPSMRQRWKEGEFKAKISYTVSSKLGAWQRTLMALPRLRQKDQDAEARWIGNTVSAKLIKSFRIQSDGAPP